MVTGPCPSGFRFDCERARRPGRRVLARRKLNWWWWPRVVAGKAENSSPAFEAQPERYLSALFGFAVLPVVADCFAECRDVAARFVASAAGHRASVRRNLSAECFVAGGHFVGAAHPAGPVERSWRKKATAIAHERPSPSLRELKLFSTNASSEIKAQSGATDAKIIRAIGKDVARIHENAEVFHET